MADSKLSPERAALMASFCEWASEIHAADEGETLLLERIREGLQRLQFGLRDYGSGQTGEQSDGG